MVTIPDASSLGARRVPQSQRGVVSFNSRAGQGLQQAGQVLGQVGAEAQRIDENNKKIQERDAREKKADRDRVIAGQSMLTAMKADSDYLDVARNNPAGYETFRTDHEKLYKTNRESILSGVPDDNQKELIGMALDENFLKTQNELSTLSRGFKKEHTTAYADQWEKNIEDMAYKNPDAVPALAASYGAYVDGNIADFGADGAMKRKLGILDKTKVQTQKRAADDFGAKSDEEKLAVLQGGGSTAPRNYNADTVKPYDAKRIASIKEMVSKPSEYDALFAEMGEKYGVDPQELKLRAAVESGLKATAQAKATPYGQSGGLMQLEVGTAKALGVTDRNDPRQSVEGAAKLLAQHQKKAAGDQAKVDKLYYAGSEKLMGPNTEQYAANLAAVRGAGNIQDPSFARMSPEDQAKWMNPEQQKKIIQNVAESELSKDPQIFIAKVDAGEYDSYFNDADKLKYKEMAIKVMDNQAKVERDTRLASASVRNTEIYNKLLANDPTLMDDVAKFRADANTVEDVEFADSIRDSYLKMNPISAEEKADISAELNAELSKFKDQEKDDIDLADMLRYQQRVIKESARGVPGLNHIISKISPVINYLADKEQGSDDKGWKIFGEAVEVYDAGYQTIQDHLEKIGKQDDVVMKQKMLSDFVEASDAIPDNIRKDKPALDKQLGIIAKNVISIYANKRTPSLRMLDDTPNGVVKSDGTIEKLGNFETAVKADTKVGDLDVVEGVNASGVRARTFSKDGKIVKVQVLNSDGSVKKEILK